MPHGAWNDELNSHRLLETSKWTRQTGIGQKVALSDFLAAERTLLAWIRTGLGLMGFGFVVARFGLFLQQLQIMQRAPLAPSLWIMALVRHRPDCTGGIVNALCRLASPSAGSGVGAGWAFALSFFDPGRPDCFFSALVGLTMAIYLVSVRSTTHSTLKMAGDNLATQ